MGTPSDHRPSFQFPKAERLSSRKHIKALFTKGASFSLYPLRFVYQTIPGPAEANVQVVISVSKRRFRHAYQRNRLKRQIREAYRHHKHQILPLVPTNQTLLLGIVYIGKSPEPFAHIQSKLKKGLDRLSDKAHLQKTNPDEQT